MSANLKNWREAASIIIAAKQSILQPKPVENINYKILTMKRSANSRFMPNTHVFPGGALDKTDCSREWLHLYKKFGIDDQKFDIFTKIKYIAPIFRNKDENLLSRHISLRICAIREAFEECGVLLCKKADQENNGNVSLWASYFNKFDIKMWQERVHNDATQFIVMCDKLKIYPDIWALHEWSNWLTPSTMNNRFDTIFFLVNVQNTISIFAEDTEVAEIEWVLPEEILDRNIKKEVFLVPVQFYEFKRLQNFSKIEQLAQFSANRFAIGTQRILPFRLKTKNATITLLPGDDLYPGEDEAQIPVTSIFENIPEKEIVHRFYHFNNFTNKIVVKNYTDEIEHICPKSDEDIEQSKL